MVKPKGYFYSTATLQGIDFPNMQYYVMLQVFSISNIGNEPC